MASLCCFDKIAAWRTLRGCVEGAGGAVCPFRAALADLARVCGERHEDARMLLASFQYQW